MNLQDLRKLLVKEIKEHRSQWGSWYEEVIHDIELGKGEKIKKSEIIIELEDVENNDVYEDLAWSQGYVEGLKKAIQLLVFGK